MNESLTSEHVRVPVRVYIAFIYRVNISFTFPSPPALPTAVCSISASSQECIYFTAPAAVFPIPLSKASSSVMHLLVYTAALFFLLDIHMQP